MTIDTQVARIGEAFATGTYLVAPHEVVACREREWLAAMGTEPDPVPARPSSWRTVWCHASLADRGRPQVDPAANGGGRLTSQRLQLAVDDANLVASIAAAKAVARVSCESKLVGRLRWSGPVHWLARPRLGERLVATATVTRRARLDSQTRALSLGIEIRSWDGARLLGSLGVVIEQSDRIAEVIELLGPVTCAA
ncbi:MAG: hypothetical protein B7733_10280 [Myxococcales bacterium FL481]|nr:MAG: hypothetical protein B7733_10280 [Myxococcales bacterium FL481]